MRRFVYSFLLSFFCASVGGWALNRWVHLRVATIVLSGLLLSLIINALFFYIRRWDGCIEKLGGLTFTILTLAAAMVPLILFRREAPSISSLICSLTVILSLQTLLIGWIGTVMMRTRNFKPPKPGDPLRW